MPLVHACSQIQKTLGVPGQKPCSTCSCTKFCKTRTTFLHCGLKKDCSPSIPQCVIDALMQETCVPIRWDCCCQQEPGCMDFLATFLGLHPGYSMWEKNRQDSGHQQICQGLGAPTVINSRFDKSEGRMNLGRLSDNFRHGLSSSSSLHFHLRCNTSGPIYSTV